MKLEWINVNGNIMARSGHDELDGDMLFYVVIENLKDNRIGIDATGFDVTRVGKPEDHETLEAAQDACQENENKLDEMHGGKAELLAACEEHVLNCATCGGDGNLPANCNRYRVGWETGVLVEEPCATCSPLREAIAKAKEGVK